MTSGAIPKNHSSKENKFFFIWAISCFVLCFLCAKNALAPIVYVIAALPLALYLFPVQPARDLINALNRGNSLKKLWYPIFSNHILSLVLCFSMAKFFLEKNATVDGIFDVVLLINAILGFVDLFIRDAKDKSVKHYLFCLFRVW